MNYFERRRSANLPDRPRTKGAPRLTHGALTRRRGGHRQLSSELDSLCTCAAEADPQVNRCHSPRKRRKKQAPIRPNGSVIFVERYLFAHSNPILNTSRRLIAATWGVQKKQETKKLNEHNENTHRGRRGGRAHGRVAPGPRLRSQHIHSGWSLSPDDGETRRARIPARDKTPAKAKAAARLVTPVAKAKTPAKAKAVAPLTAVSPSNLTGNS